MPNWQGSDRRARLPEDWAERRQLVLIRDRHRCQHVREDTGKPCLVRARDVDHVIANDNHDLSNLQALCGWHHDQKSGREGGIASGKARRATRDAKKKPHAGYL
jgi:5-methylcytosine-specific restriction protein A